MPDHPPDDAASRTSLRRPSRLPWIVLVVAVVAAVAAVLLRWWMESGPPEITSTAAPAPTETPTPAPTGTGGAASGDARALLEAASSNALYRREIATDLPRRAALVLSALAHGESPRKALPGLAPARPFQTLSRGGATVIAPASYARYDAFADAVASVDPEKLAIAYRALRPPLEAALRAAGYPDAGLDDFAARALRRIASAPVRDGDVAVVPRGAGYAFADATLEDRAETEKHLLRMGPRNTRLLQEKARALLQALGLPGAGP